MKPFEEAEAGLQLRLVSEPWFVLTGRHSEGDRIIVYVRDGYPMPSLPSHHEGWPVVARRISVVNHQINQGDYE